MTSLRAILRTDAGPVAQFVKYAVSGGIASAVNLVVLFLAAWFLFPCLTAEDPFVRLAARLGYDIPIPEIDNALRARRASVLCPVPAFIVSNVVCYVLNVLFVFRSGRHGRRLEFALFLLASLVATAAGGGLSYLLVHRLGIATTYAFASNIVTAVLVNYIARKKLVFRG